MRIAFVIQDHIETTLNIGAALRKRGHDVDELVYCPNGRSEFSLRHRAGSIVIAIGDREINPKDYDAALNWCWGTARAAATIMACFEDVDVPVLAPTRLTRVSDSKITTTELFELRGLSAPSTVLFRRGEPFDPDRLKPLDGLPFVFKFDYSTRGQGVQICSSVDEIASLAALRSSRTHGYLVQACIRDPSDFISTYRVLVIGDEIVPTTFKFTPADPLSLWDMNNEGTIEVLDTPTDLGNLAREATRLMGLTVCGVDLLLDNLGHPMVLECNDAPATHRFDNNHVPVSQMAADAFLALVQRII